MKRGFYISIFQLLIQLNNEHVMFLSLLYCSQCEDRHATENDPKGSVDERAMVTNCRVLRGNYVSKMKWLETESNKHFDG